MKPNICFLYAWDDQNPHAWSGTPQGLYNSLSKKTNVRKLNVSLPQKNFIQRIIYEILFPASGYSHAKKVINRDPDFDPHIPYFSFGEYPSKIVSHTFCYQDLSIDYILRELWRKNSKCSHWSIFKKVAYQISLSAKAKQAHRFYHDCGGVFTMSEWLKKDLIENTGLPENKVFHVGGGCSVDITRVDFTQKRGNKFLFVGKDWERKNGELVVQAFTKLSQLHPERDIELYIVGPKNQPKSTLGHPCIHFLGRLDYSSLVQYYNLCDFFVMPSNFEAYGLVFLEALIFGLPCIGKNCFAMPEFIQPGLNGYLIEQNDVDELTAVMERLLLDGNDMSKFVQDNHQFYAEKYSWDTVANRIISILEQQGFLISKNDE